MKSFIKQNLLTNMDRCTMILDPNTQVVIGGKHGYETKQMSKKNSTVFLVYFLLTGLGGLFSGFIHLMSLLTEFASIALLDMLFNSTIGILNLVCAFLFWKKNPLVVWIFGVIFVLVQLYAPIMGRDFNLIMFVITGVVFMLLLSLRRDEQLH